MRGPAKCFFHRPCWEIFAMVSVQIWVIRFHIRGTGEQRQVCLAAVTGCPFFFHRARTAARSTTCDKRCFCTLLSTKKWHHRAACCQCQTGLPEQSPGATRPTASQPNTGRRRVRVLRRIGTSVSQACCCSTHMKTSSFTSSVLWLSRL